MAKQVENDNVREELQESGFPAPKPPPATGPMPPGGSQWAVPYFQEFAATMDLMVRTHYWTYDNAVANSWLNARVMRDDYIIKQAIHQRIIPVAMLEYQLNSVDESNPRLKDNAQKITEIINTIPRLQDMKRWLLEDTFFGRSAVQLTAGFNYDLGFKRTMVTNWSPVHADSIVFKYDDQTPGIMVNTSQYQGTWEATPRAPTHFLYDPAELEMFIWSEFEVEAVDYWWPERTGAVHGLGYRGTLYWLWWLRESLTKILMDFLQKIGTGFTIFYYEAGNAQSLADVKAAALTQIGNNVYLFPRNREGATEYGPGIERKEVGMAGADFLWTVFEGLNAIMRQAILGEVGTTEDMATGLGSSVGEQHGITADIRTKYDAVRLDGAMQRIVNAISRWNFPGDPPPKYVTLVEKRNPEEFAESLQIALQVGLTVSEAQVREILGLPKPKDGEPVLGGPQPLQPTAVGSVPQGMPISAPTGPAAAVPGGAATPTVSSEENAPPVVQGSPVAQAMSRINRRLFLSKNGKH